jgi:DNA-binding Lrp family transcriptional regulator
LEGHLPIETDVTPGPAGRSAAELDDVDRAILAELRRDGRLSIRTLAERVHISRTSAYARLDRLLADQVITGFSAEISPRRAGLGTSAYVLLTIEQNSWRSVAKALRGIRYIEHLALVGGDFDVLALVHAPDNVALREVVLEKIQSIKGVRATRTWLVFEEDPGMGPQWG